MAVPSINPPADGTWDPWYGDIRPGVHLCPTDAVKNLMRRKKYLRPLWFSLDSSHRTIFSLSLHLLVVSLSNFLAIVVFFVSQVWFAPLAEDFGDRKPRSTLLTVRWARRVNELHVSPRNKWRTRFFIRKIWTAYSQTYLSPIKAAWTLKVQV